MPDVTYHLQSLALTMVTVSVVTLLCLAPALLRFADEFRLSMRAWVVGTALVVATDVIFFLGLEIPRLAALLTAIAGLGVAEWIHALRLYNNHASRRWWPYVAIAVGMTVMLAIPSYPTSVLVTSVLYAALYLEAAREALGIREPARSVGRTLLVCVFLLVALVMLGRLVLFVSGIRSGAPPGFTSPVRALMFVIASIAPIAASFAFVLTSGERLGDRLLRWSLTDSLTELPNRRAFFGALSQAVSSGRRRSAPMSLLVIDLDHFKWINDTAGHEAGDHVLVEVGRLLAASARSEDTVGRLGGEEFAVVVPGADLESAIVLAERVKHAIGGKPIRVGERAFELTASIGVVTWDGIEEPSALLSRADGLLYQAKERGRNRVIVESAPRTDP